MKEMAMAYPTHDDRSRPSEYSQGTYGYEVPRGAEDAPSGRSVLYMLGAIVVVIALVALFSWSGTDNTTTGSITQQPAPMEQGTQPVQPGPPVAPAQ
jgi:hypothetical protein